MWRFEEQLVQGADGACVAAAWPHLGSLRHSLVFTSLLSPSDHYSVFLFPLHSLRMPRIKPRALRQAFAIDPSLSSFLPVCRDLRSAQAELRWLGEHALTVSRRCPNDYHHLLRSYVKRRSTGEPLQYILGSEYFGDLEIRCRPGVLIPRFVCISVYSFLPSCF